MLEQALQRVKKNLDDWHMSLENPAGTQDILYESLLDDYAKTEYAQKNKEFPVAKYNDLEPWIECVRRGSHEALLAEKPFTWVMTRGTTGNNKIIPVTPRHLEHIVKGGSRAVLNYAMDEGIPATLTGGVLNLQFPSNVRAMSVNDEETTFGFSSGTYAKLNPMMAGLRLVPRQEEIDALDSDLSEEGWKRRYEYIYMKAKDMDVVTVMGVAPVQTGFARYLKNRHQVLPRDIWDLKVIFSTSVAKIHSKYAPWLKRLYGECPVVEMYTATEGAFGQQLDAYPYWVPNYDLYYFEVRVGKEVKMLHDLRRGEWGRLIVSTPLFPRYEIGDLVEAMGKNYFRVFGRDRPLTVLEHILYKATFSWALR